MSTDNFDFPVQGVTGTGYRNKMSSAFNAVASTNKSAGDPPTILDGMLQITDTSPATLRVREGGEWVTLMPDLSLPYGGLELSTTSQPPKHYVYATFGVIEPYTPIAGNSFSTNIDRYVNFLLEVQDDPDSLFDVNQDYTVPETGWYDVTLGLRIEGPSPSSDAVVFVSLYGQGSDGSNVVVRHDERAVRDNYHSRITASYFFQQGQVLSPHVRVFSPNTFTCYLSQVHYMVKWSDINLGVQ